VAVRKKRGKRAPPSSKRLRDKKVDKEIDSDDADNDIDGTDGQIGKNQSDVHSEECVDGTTSDGLQKTGQSGNSDGPTLASGEQVHSTDSKDILQKKSSSQTTKKVSRSSTRSSTRSRQGASHLEQEGADEDDSHGQMAVVNKDVDGERSSHEIKDDVSSLV